MFDIGSIELLVVAVLALVVVGPRELPGIIRGIGKAMGVMRSLTNEVKAAASNLADEVERENAAKSDSYADLRRAEGVTADMSPEEVTNTIMANRAREKAEASELESKSVETASLDLSTAQAPGTDKPESTDGEGSDAGPVGSSDASSGAEEANAKGAKNGE